MEKKVVCERVKVDTATGSRLGGTTKQCREVEVEVKKEKGKDSHGASHSAQAQ